MAFSDNPFEVIEKVADVMKFIGEKIPWWIILLGGLAIAVLLPAVISAG